MRIVHTISTEKDPFPPPEITVKFESEDIQGISILFDDACSLKEYYTNFIIKDSEGNDYKYSGRNFPWEPVIVKGNSFVYKFDKTDSLDKDYYGWKFTVNGLNELPDEKIKTVQTRHPQRGCKLEGEITFPDCEAMILEFDTQCSSRKYYDSLIITPGNGGDEIKYCQESDNWPKDPVVIQSNTITYKWKAIGKMVGEYYGFKFTASPK